MITTWNKEKRELRLTRSRFRGMSLIEIVVMLSISSAMLVMTTGWIHQTMKQSGRFRLEHQKQLALTQLSQHFRKQVWSSSVAEVAEPNSVSLTDSRGHRSDYTFSGHGIEFVQRDFSGEVVSMEPFDLPPETKVNFALGNHSDVILKVEEPVYAAVEASESRNPEWRTTLIIKPTVARWLAQSSSSKPNRPVKPTTEGEESPE